MKKISIIGANGMLSVALTKYFYAQNSTEVIVYGLDEPEDYQCHLFNQINLLKDKIDYESIMMDNINSIKLEVIK